MPIREAAADDLEGVRRVARASWETDYPDILSRESVDEGIEEWYDLDALAAEFDRGRTLLSVAEEDGEVVGFAHATWTGEEGHVLRLYVHPNHRDEGAGRALLERTETELRNRGVDRIDAMVLAENDLGRAFYEAFGFEEVDTGETTIGGETYRESRYALGS